MVGAIRVGIRVRVERAYRTITGAINLLITVVFQVES